MFVFTSNSWMATNASHCVVELLARDLTLPKLQKVVCPAHSDSAAIQFCRYWTAHTQSAPSSTTASFKSMEKKKSKDRRDILAEVVFSIATSNTGQFSSA